MSKLQRAFLLTLLCMTGGLAHAGLFSDGEKLQQLESRVSGLEDAGKHQAEAGTQLSGVVDQQSRALLDLQSQLESQNSELRIIRGQNEELVHGLQDAEKRQKDFYIDLDTRLRHIEEAQDRSTATASDFPAPAPALATADGAVGEDPAIENRAYEAAYNLFKAAKYADATSAFQDFLNKYPDSVYTPNIHYEMGRMYLAQKDCKNAVTSLEMVMVKYAYSPKTPDAMLKVADCKLEFGDKPGAWNLLKLIISRYPDSGTATDAKSRLANIK